MRGQWQISRFEVISLRPARTQLWSCITEYIWWSWDEPLWSRGFLAANRQMYCKPVTLPWSGPNHQIKVALSPYIIILELRTATMMFHLPPPTTQETPVSACYFTSATVHSIYSSSSRFSRKSWGRDTSMVLVRMLLSCQNRGDFSVKILSSGEARL